MFSYVRNCMCDSCDSIDVLFKLGDIPTKSRYYVKWRCSRCLKRISSYKYKDEIEFVQWMDSHLDFKPVLADLVHPNPYIRNLSETLWKERT